MKPVTPGFGLDADAIEQLDSLYRSERPSLVRMFARNQASAEDADDLAQEAFLRLAGAQNGASQIAKPIWYLRQISRNLLKDRAKAGYRLVDPTDNVELEQTILDSDELARLEARDSLRRIEAAMHRLKPRTREIFLAHRLDGMSYGEIAERTGMSVKGVEKQMSKAIAALGRAMEQQR